MSIATLGLLAAEEAQNAFWLPHDIWEVFWGSLAFLIIVFLLSKFGRKFVAEGLAKRTNGIEESLTKARAARESAEAERNRITEALADSDSEAGRIIEDARRSADALTAEIAARAERDVVAVRERAQADLGATRSQMEADVAGELSRLALGAAEKVVEESLDTSGQQRLIDDYINSVGARN